ncbi:MAG: DUF1343 domain-containing protein [Thermoanaerobaculia bacterium]|nr:DUF1343 domain-containing protein [Thermoanaerobaculia bacterium]
MPRHHAFALLVALAVGCHPPLPLSAPPVTPPVVTAAAPPAPSAWVETTLAGLTLPQKAAQILFVRAGGPYRSPAAPENRELRSWVAELGVGGVVLFATELEAVPRHLGDLQRLAPVPLLVASDLERGLSFRVDPGPVPLPSAMAFGATGSEDAAYFLGEVTAREARAVGIHWALAPVVDVNNNPDNPVINIRSFGEDPALVGRLGAAFVRGARAGGVLTSAKHFPGHGDTATDSHLARPRLTGSRERLDTVELAPFRELIAAGVDSIMVGHLEAPALDATYTPATLSRAIITDLLRGELRFDGVVVTDALDMTGLRPAWTGEAVVDAVVAGADVLLLPHDPRVAVGELVRAVESGRLPVARLDEAVRRVLVWKARLGLDRERMPDAAEIPRAVARPEDVARGREIAEAAITVVKNHGGVLPLAVESDLSLLHLVLSSDFSDRTIRGIPESEFEARNVPVETVRLGPEIAEDTARRLLARARTASHVVVSAFVKVTSGKGTVDMVPRQAQFLTELAATGVPVVVVSYGSPYLLRQFPAVPVYLCAYGSSEASQRAAVAALFGEFEVGGRLPVTLPGLAARGDGLVVPRRVLALTAGRPEDAGFRPEAMAEIDALLAGYVERRAFPGGVVAIGRQGKLVHLRAFGRQTYDADAPPVTAETLYDLASLTKVVTTTTVAMTLVDDGRLDLDKAVQDYLPEFVGPGKEVVTVRHLLTHSSGIDWWAPLYQDTRGAAEFVRKIAAMPLVNPPGSTMKYSDLGLILLGEILERVTGRSLDALARERVFRPLGFADTGFRPARELRPRIAPTEVVDGQVIHGEVHDENARALGGVAAHAGLFGTAPELARFAQMLLWRGVYDQRRIVTRETVALFTQRAGVPVDSDRALGWDTRSATGFSAGQLFSARSFGHTGFTGTSLWIDPERDLFVLLLTNRVHPTRDNNLIREVRPALADAVVRGLVEPVLPSTVRVGLDRIAAGEDFGLTGKRLGLLLHRASVTADGRGSLAVFQERNLDVVRLFTPEHGLTGAAAAGENVASGVDPTSGLPVVSLYGDHHTPSREDLAGLDALVIDLQDAGVRFYTYASTLLLALEAAHAAGLPVVVLDRPNPLGGEYVAGPVARRDLVPASLVNRAPGPLVHGLTLGELARYAAPPGAQLTVVPMLGWRRTMTWAATGRPWVPPSPNLRTPAAALAYPGTALLEATNVSEGRGIDAPFLTVGAPWLSRDQQPGRIPGFFIYPARFTPTSSPAAPNPKFVGVECWGWRLAPTGGGDSWKMGLETLKVLSRNSEFRWNDDGAGLTWLLGTPEVLNAFRAQKPVSAILAAEAPGLERWRAERRRALLYLE